jgi:hypothetical protein
MNQTPSSFESDRAWQNLRVLLLGLCGAAIDRAVTHEASIPVLIAGAGAAITFLLTWLYGLRKLRRFHSR